MAIERNPVVLLPRAREDAKVPKVGRVSDGMEIERFQSADPRWKMGGRNREI
jgi:hypothetical protein